ncbi:MAG: hypothetical protein SFV22_14105 [Saprospiraceae bacterium]|nr:hypothetical protein [Saprospiraceae bacterium]
MDAENNPFTQEEIRKLLQPAFDTDSRCYRKKTDVLVRAAQEGELIITCTADGEETRNKAEAGDFVLKNKTEAGEEYLVSKETLDDRYTFLEKADEVYARYRPNGTIQAISLDEAYFTSLSLHNPFRFMAEWGETMIVRAGDYLVRTDSGEVYRIARKEFFETYEICPAK